MFYGAFIQVGILADETEDKDVLNWLYKDEEETRPAVVDIAIPAEQYGNRWDTNEKVLLASMRKVSQI